jgi:hypothetical protein
MSKDARTKTEPSRNGRAGLLRTVFAAALVATSLSPLARSPALAQQPNTSTVGLQGRDVTIAFSVDEVAG